MTLYPSLALYNQDRAGDDDFVSAFVARQAEFEQLLSSLKAQADGGVSQHHLIVGARGMGKTSLLRRIAIGIGADARLATHFAPLRFREEQYNVLTLDRFWRNCAEAMAEWCEANGLDNLAARLDAAVESPAWRDATTAADEFSDICHEIGRRPVLLIDNLDLILDALKPEVHWQMRRVLQNPHGPVLIGAATQFLAQSTDRDAAFYEFFHPLVLDPLSADEVLDCLKALADLRGEAGAPVQQILAREPERLRTLHTLTGGNPRVLGLVYQLLERRETADVFADLEALLDQVTPYFKARVEEFATAQQRAVIDAIALNWDPILASGIAEVTGIAVTTISGHLDRLRKAGFVEEVSTSGARAGYQIAERFLNIWYLMRHGSRRLRQRLRWLTLFLQRFYDRDELARLAGEAGTAGLVRRWHPHYREAVIAAFEDLSRSYSGPSAAEAAPAFAGGTVALLKRLFGHVDECLDEAVLPEIDARLKAAEAADPAKPELVAACLRCMGFVFGRLDRREDAVAIYDDLVGRFGGAKEPVIRFHVAAALRNKGVALGQLDRSEDAVAVYDDLVGHFSDAQEPALREQVATALFNKGVTLAQLGRSADAVAVYDDLVGRFGEAQGPAMREQVARALVYEGFTLGQLGRSEVAVAVYDDLVGRFGEAQEPALREQVATALFNKGVTLAELDRSADAVAVYDDLVGRFGEAQEPALREQVAKALVNKGITLDQLGRSEDAVAVFDDLVGRFGEAQEPAMREQVARALVYEGFTLGQLGRSEDAVAVFDDLVGRFGEAQEPALREEVARALVNKGVTLGEIGRSEEALAVYDDLLARFGEAQEPALREGVARALVNKGITLGQLDRSEDAVAVYDDLVGRFGKAQEPALREQVAGALYYKGVRLRLLGRSADAVAVFDDLVGRFGDAEEPVLREPVAWAIMQKAHIMLDEWDDVAGAIALYRRTAEFAPDRSHALANLAWALLVSGQVKEADALQAGLSDRPEAGRLHLEAALAFASDNFGEATERLGRASALPLSSGGFVSGADLVRLLRIAEARGYGEKLIDWFVSSGLAETQAVVYAAFVAYVKGERFLKDFSLEVRAPAQVLYERLDLPRRHRRARNPAPEDRKPRGRPRRR